MLQKQLKKFMASLKIFKCFPEWVLNSPKEPVSKRIISMRFGEIMLSFTK